MASKLYLCLPAYSVIIFCTCFMFSATGECCMQQMNDNKIISLPKPNISGQKTLEEILVARRSVRNFSNKTLNLKQISQLLWAAQGITAKNGSRTAPSAGALYPLLVYVISGANENLSAGVYQYHPDRHSLHQMSSKDLRREFCDAGLSQPSIENAPVTFLITGIFQKATVKYGQRGIQYVLIEAGHVGQNILLQAEALDLGAVPIGAFQDKEVMRLMEFSADEHPLYLIPVGHKIDR